MFKIEDMINPVSIGGYFKENGNDGSNGKNPEYLYHYLFDDANVPGDTVRTYTGSALQHGMMSLSANDTTSIKRGNNELKERSFTLLQFKNNKVIDESQLRGIRNALVNNYDKESLMRITNTPLSNAAELLASAEDSREILAMTALTRGEIVVPTEDGSLNEAVAPMDLGIKDYNKFNTKTTWGKGTASDTPIDDLIDAMEQVRQANSTVVTTAIMNRKTFRKLAKSKQVANALSVNSNNSNVPFSNQSVIDLVKDTAGLDIKIYDKVIKNIQLIPDDKVILVPEGKIGHMYSGQTNEELGLSGTPNVPMKIQNNGVAITTEKNTDPVGIKVLASQVVLPVIEAINNIVIMNVNAD